MDEKNVDTAYHILNIFQILAMHLRCHNKYGKLIFSKLKPFFKLFHFILLKVAFRTSNLKAVLIKILNNWVY